MKTLTSLLERLNLDPEVLEACARNAEALGLPLERALYEAERINENQYLETAAARHAMPCELRLAALMDKEGSGWATDAERVCKVPLPWLRKQKVVPVRDKDGKLALAICHPSGWLLAQELGMLLGERLERPVLAREDDITDIINRIFGESTRSEGSVSDVLGDSVNAIDEFNEDAVEDLLEDSSEAPFIRLVNMILAQAVRAGASDIHIEPYRDVSRVRFRLDGVLYERHTLNKAHHAAVVSRIKVMAGMDIAVHQQPQDGHILFQPRGRRIDIRVSSLPASSGEVIVMRLMDVSAQLFSLDELGFSKKDTATLRELIHRPAGMIVLCGPMNSGKTSSLYAALTELNTESRNLVTLEDPIERILPGVNQVQIHPKAGMTFVAGLRAVLRQDVTGILLGEIRDEETAAMAVRIALTGHLLMTTIHTEDAVSALYRMLEMGIAPYLLAATLSGIVSQRLVRRLCPDCREAYRVAEGSDEAAFFACAEGTELYRSRGCAACHGTGYRGRTVLAELLVPYEAVREGILQKIPRREMVERAKACGMRSLLEDGREKAKAGITSWQEVRRVLYG